jgi:hypothetical protein
MTPQQILNVRAELMRRGFTQTSAAKEIGVSARTLRLVLLGVGKSKRVEHGLSKILGGWNPVAQPEGSPPPEVA